MTKPSKPLTYVTIPAGSQIARRCKACDTALYFVDVAVGKRVPVDADANEQCHHPTATEDGMGVNHFQTCSDPARFSKARRASR